jgi:hypothetical protein
MAADLVGDLLFLVHGRLRQKRARRNGSCPKLLIDGNIGIRSDLGVLAVNLPLAEKLLEVPVELVRTALDLERTEGTVITDSVGETPCVFLARLHRAERSIAERLIRLAHGTLPWP